jgi:hypothetical protein
MNMDNFRTKEKAKAAAKLEVINAILDDIKQFDLSKASILALISGYKKGLTSVHNWYDSKENETFIKNAEEVLNS